MKQSNGNRSQPRNAEGRFESKNQANQQKPTPKSGNTKDGLGPSSNDRCRDDMGRFEPCK